MHDPHSVRHLSARHSKAQTQIPQHISDQQYNRDSSDPSWPKKGRPLPGRGPRADRPALGRLEDAGCEDYLRAHPPPWWGHQKPGEAGVSEFRGGFEACQTTLQFGEQEATGELARAPHGSKPMGSRSPAAAILGGQLRSGSISGYGK